MSILFSRTSTLFCLSLCAILNVQAQTIDRLDLHQQPLAKMKQSSAELIGRTATVHQRHARALGFDGDTRLVLKDRQTSHGVRSHRYRQIFRGLPVYGDDVIVNEDTNGNLRSLFGSKVEGLLDSALPAGRIRVQKANALKIAKSVGLGNRFGFMKTQNEQAELNVFIDDTRRPYRAWIVSYFADTARSGSPTRPTIVVDADSGRVLKQWEGLTKADIGTGPGGNLKTGLYEYGTTRFFGYLDVQQLANNQCAMTNTRVNTVDLNGASDLPSNWWSPFVFACPRNIRKEVNGAYSPLNDAHYFGGVVHDLFVSQIGQRPFPRVIDQFVHYGVDYEGAYWNGQGIFIGDGYENNKTYPWAVLDVIAHEVGHAFTGQNANLQPDRESGRISEAYSDLVGEAAEFYMRGRNDWIFGANVMKVAEGIRRLDTPAVNHVLNQTGNFYEDSGVYSRAFYLLATTPGWDILKVFKVATRANDLYWTIGTNYQRGVCGLRTAAQDLGYNPVDVDNAFDQVGVMCATPVKMFSKLDASGSVEIAVFERYADIAKSVHKDFLVTIPDESYVLIGGGVEGTDGPIGHLITASRPGGKQWVVSTKDHLEADPQRIRAWAIGLRIAGMPSYSAANSLNVTVTTSSPVAAHPQAIAEVPYGYTLIGGGFSVNWNGAGNLAVESAPVGTTGWRARSKDHLVSSPATITSYAISIAKNVGIFDNTGWTFYNFSSIVDTDTSAVASRPSAEAILRNGYALSGCGGSIAWQGMGNLLWKIKPTNPGRGQTGCAVGGKDHLAPDPAAATAYAIGLRRDP